MSDMLIEIKNKLSSKFLKGLIVVFSLWWYLFFVSSMFVINVLSVIDSFSVFINNVEFNISSSVVVVNVFCMLEVVIKWNIGCSK